MGDNFRSLGRRQAGADLFHWCKAHGVPVKRVVAEAGGLTLVLHPASTDAARERMRTRVVGLLAEFPRKPRESLGFLLLFPGRAV